MFSLSINESLVWLACATALALSAIVYAGYRLFVRPRRWRLRALADICPACKYDISKPKTTRCPECGLHVTSDGGRPTPRQHRRVLLLSAVLLGLSLNIFLGKPWNRSTETWSRLLPTTLLLALTSSVNDTSAELFPSILGWRYNTVQMWRWQERWVLRKMCYLLDHEKLLPLARTRSHWPVGIPVYAENWIFPSDMDNRWQCDTLLRDPRSAKVVGWAAGDRTAARWHDAEVVMIADGVATPLAIGESRLRLRLELSQGQRDRVLIRTYDASQPITVVGSVDEVIKPDTSDALTSFVRSSLRVSWSSMIWSGPSESGVSRRLEFSLIPLPSSRSTAYAFRVDLTRNGNSIGALHAWLRLSNYEYRTSHIWSSGDLNAILTAFDNPEGVTARVSSDPELALRDFEATSYWSGAFEVPLRDLLATPPAPSP